MSGVDLYVNLYRIWWCPTQVAMHLRLQLGRKGTELVHMVADESPTMLEWHDYRNPVQTILVGSTDLSVVDLARSRVDPHFSYYNALYRNCTAYVYCLLSEILGEQPDVLDMVARTNRPFANYFGTDFVDINLQMGCWHALRWAADSRRACHVALRLPSSSVPEAVVAVLGAQYSRCSCRLRRDKTLRRACAAALEGSGVDAHYRFLWVGILRAVTTTERLYQLSGICCDEW